MFYLPVKEPRGKNLPTDCLKNTKSKRQGNGRNSKVSENAFFGLLAVKFKGAPGPTA